VVLWELREAFLVSYLCEIADLERTKLRLLDLRDNSCIEALVGAISAPEWIKRAMLLDRVLERASLVQDQRGSSLVVESSHVFFALVGIFHVRNHLLEGARVGASLHLLERLGWWTSVFEIKLLLVFELGVTHELATATRLEGAMQRLLAGI